MEGDRKVRGTGRAMPIMTLLVVGLLLLSAAGSMTSGAEIHDPVNSRSLVSDDADASWPSDADQDSGDVAIDTFGRIHVAWQDQREGRHMIMYARSDDGGRSFGPSIRVNDVHPSIEYFDPSICVDRDGNPFVVWHDPRNSLTTGLDIFLARSYDGGDTFGPNVLVNPGSDRPETSPDVSVSPGGKVFVVYMSGLGAAADIYIRFSDDGGRTFGPRTWVDDDSTGKRQLKPVVVGDANGIAHMAWTDMRNGNSDIYYSTRTVLGTTTSVTKVNSDTGGANQDDPAITLHDGTPLVVWRDDRNGNPDIYMAMRSSPTSFGTNRLINDDATTTNQAEPDVAVVPPTDVGQDPRIHIVWKGVGTGSSDIYLANSTDAGVTFSKEVLVNTDARSGATQHKPAVARRHGQGLGRPRRLAEHHRCQHPGDGVRRQGEGVRDFTRHRGRPRR
jgi:hypothetical protein